MNRPLAGRLTEGVAEFWLPNTITAMSRKGHADGPPSVQPFPCQAGQP